MKASRFSDVRRRSFLSRVLTACRWRIFAARPGSARRPTSIGRYDGLLPTEMRRLKQLEDENSKLRKVVADLSLDKEMLQDAPRRKL
jgi:putative transposase